MRISLAVARVIVSNVAVAVGLTGCTTAQLQKQYPSFDACFREQKVLATVGGALIGGILGGAVGPGGKQGAAVTAAGAAVGAIIGHRVAWESCLKAFPRKLQTTVVAPRLAPVPGTPTDIARSLTIQRVAAQPLVFGTDLEASAQYVFVSDKPGALDVKARVSRNLLFTTPDGKKQEIASSSEDTIQQGTSRTTFAIPTPSLQDAPELAQTSDWAIKFVVEADGMRQEQIVPLQVTGLQQATQSEPVKAPQQTPVSPQQQQAIQASTVTEPPVPVPAGTVLVDAPNSSKVVARNKQAVSARVLQRTVIGGVTWLHVEIPGGVRGWIRGARK